MATPRRKKPAPKKPAAPKKKSRSRDDATLAALPKKAAASINKERVRYHALLREIDVASIDEHRGWDRKWEAAGEILARKYFIFDDEAPTASQWVVKHLGETHRTSVRNARVAKVASPDEEKKYTVSKLDVAYSIELAKLSADAKDKGVAWKAPEEPIPVDFASLRYKIVRDGVEHTVDLEEITLDELRAVQRGDSRDGGAQDARASELLKDVLSLLTKKNGLSNVSASERDNEFNFGHVRRDQFEAFGRVLIELAKRDTDD
jgi:hypothetical protein